MLFPMIPCFNPPFTHLPFPIPSTSTSTHHINPSHSARLTDLITSFSFTMLNWPPCVITAHTHTTHTDAYTHTYTQEHTHNHKHRGTYFSVCVQHLLHSLCVFICSNVCIPCVCTRVFRRVCVCVLSRLCVCV